MNNDYVLPYIAGNGLMVAFSNGWWLLVIAGWVIVKIVNNQ